jgi:hypothetical protein
MDLNRIISLLIALIYVICAYLSEGGQTALITAGVMVFVLVLIWFSDALGGFTGYIGWDSPPIPQQTPGSIVRIMGWFFLLLPALVYLIMLLRNKPPDS